MNFRNKPADKVEPFVVPSLAECCPEYAKLVDLRVKLETEQTEIAGKVKRLVIELDGLPRPVRPVSREVAALLGETVDNTRAVKEAELVEARRRKAALDAAIPEVHRRIADARAQASRAACARIKAEFGRRTAAICDAMVILDVAHKEFDKFIDDCEVEDISWMPLGDMRPSMLGDARDPQRRIALHLNKVREAGYWPEDAR